ncbi:fasciculation and elongation protein zeta-2-like isoform X2 [Penaeus chinensis]|uniref:fasciculation and elongation protein zeta-2-like isoform X2 n=2 Tax=Penaeus TaxID=133894 RepID=UPI001FB5952F|nr:fasciculation and elongation protein zeta-2-like isoform X2 [Penaeus chinensis]
MVELREGKMAELEVSVPLAKFDTDEWAEFSDFQSSQDTNCNPTTPNTTGTTPEKNDNDFLDNMSDTTENFKDTFSTSLEDLVNCFDDKITKCFCNYEDKVEKYAPVQVRTQEEIMNDCQMWWTITGNFGNILPIDWSKTYTRQQYLPVLNLNEAKSPGANEEAANPEEDAEEEEEVAQDLDLHHLILNGLSAEPVKSAEEVIREIDDIMQEGSSSEDEGVEESTSSGENSQDSSVRPLPPPLYADKLKSMSVAELNESVMELELVIREYSETLINQLALRDELEYEKELKNSFISLLLQVQNKRRNFNVEKKKQKKYLTTVIPYDVGHGPPENQTLQILIKILMAINEDSPTVPTLLTDYILKVLCPS